MICFNFSEHYSMSNILSKDSSKVSYTQKLIVSKFDNFAKITLRVTETDNGIPCFDIKQLERVPGHFGP